MDGKLKSIPGLWIPATSMAGGSAEEDMESSPPIHAGMTSLGNSEGNLASRDWHFQKQRLAV